MSRSATLRLYYDGWCVLCQRSARLVHALDRAGRIELVDFRTTDRFVADGITGHDVARRMWAVDVRSRRAAAGFEALRLLAQQLVLLWPLRPVLALAALAGQGERLYDYIALRRRIVPDPRSCDLGRDR